MNCALMVVSFLFSFAGLWFMVWGVDAGKVVFPVEWLEPLVIAPTAIGGLLVLAVTIGIGRLSFPRNNREALVVIFGKAVSLIVLLFSVGTWNGLVVYGLSEMAVLAGGVGWYFFLYTVLVPRAMSEQVVSGSRWVERALGVVLGVPLILWALALASGGWSTAVNESVFGSTVGALFIIVSFIAAVTSMVFALLRPTLQWYQDYIDTERRESHRKKK